MAVDQCSPDPIKKTSSRFANMRSPRSTRCLNYLRDFSGQSTSDVAEYRKKSRLKSGKNPEPIGKSVRLCNTENQCLSRSCIRLDGQQCLTDYGKKILPNSREEILQESGKTGSARPGGSDGEKYVREGRARRDAVGLDHSGRCATSPTHDALSSSPSKRNDDPNTRSERHRTNARAW